MWNTVGEVAGWLNYLSSMETYYQSRDNYRSDGENVLIRTDELPNERL
ncbi:MULTISPECIES: hypothetical protein [Bacillus cereus group]|nr:hypothetical protein [Bacillus thuringiensis]